MKAKTVVILTALIVLLAGGSITLVALCPEKPQWPEIPSTPDGSPSIYVECKPDFGYQIGDLLPITIYIKQCLNTTVDLDSIALEGDFEIKGDHTFTTNKNYKAGCEVTAVKLVLQSFELKDVLSAKVSLTWNQNGSADYHELTAPAFAIHLSRIYDGRKDPQEGDQLFVDGNHLLLAVSLTAISLAGCLICALWIWHFYRMQRLLSQYQLPSKRAFVKKRFDEIWEKIAAGDQSEMNFREIESLIRNLLGVQAIVLSKLPKIFRRSNFTVHAWRVLFLLDRCERVVFRGRPLSEKDLGKFHQAFDEFINNKIFASDDYLHPQHVPKNQVTKNLCLHQDMSRQ